jgi:alpha-ketoglutarate-dependent taurine dioxygenase
VGIRFENIKEKIGSRVVWDDRADLFTPEAAAAIRAKVEERTVLVFPALHLTDDEQLRITDLMGGRIKLTGRFNVQNNDDNVYQVTLDEKINPQPEYVLGTFFWHMDGITVDSPPPFATLLSCRIAPDKGGETEFASTYAAWEGLPEEEKADIEGLRAVHSVKAAFRRSPTQFLKSTARKCSASASSRSIRWSGRTSRAASRWSLARPPITSSASRFPWAGRC